MQYGRASGLIGVREAHLVRSGIALGVAHVTDKLAVLFHNLNRGSVFTGIVSPAAWRGAGLAHLIGEGLVFHGIGKRTGELAGVGLFTLSIGGNGNVSQLRRRFRIIAGSLGLEGERRIGRSFSALNLLLYLKIERTLFKFIVSGIADSQAWGNFEFGGLFISGIVIILGGVALEHHIGVAGIADLVTGGRHGLNKVVERVGGERIILITEAHLALVVACLGVDPFGHDVTLSGLIEVDLPKLESGALKVLLTGRIGFD